MDDVITAIESGHNVEIARLALDGLSNGSCSGVDGAVSRSRGARQRIQTYDALVRLRHGAGRVDGRQELMETCKNKKKTTNSTIPDGPEKDSRCLEKKTWETTGVWRVPQREKLGFWYEG